MKALLAALFVLATVLLVNCEVVQLSSATFDDVVKDPSKDVFVKFYAPWCGHCVRMQPAWEELSKNSNGVVIAELDATAHQAPASRFGVRGFPTIKLFTKSDKSGKTFQGARDAKSFQDFLKSNV